MFRVAVEPTALSVTTVTILCRLFRDNYRIQL